MNDTVYRIFMDGDAWCAVNQDFTCLQESPAGFGNTPQAALADLQVQQRKPRQKEGEK